MVYLSSCSVCGGRTHNRKDCPSCAVAKLEDLLYHVQRYIKNGKKLPEKVKQTILSDKYTTLDVFLKNKRKEDAEIFDEQMRQGLKQNWLGQKSSEFDKKFPPKTKIKF